MSFIDNLSINNSWHYPLYTKKPILIIEFYKWKYQTIFTFKLFLLTDLFNYLLILRNKINIILRDTDL